jgi:hypothetical protein
MQNGHEEESPREEDSSAEDSPDRDFTGPPS